MRIIVSLNSRNDYRWSFTKRNRDVIPISDIRKS